MKERGKKRFPSVAKNKKLREMVRVTLWQEDVRDIWLLGSKGDIEAIHFRFLFVKLFWVDNIVRSGAKDSRHWRDTTQVESFQSENGPAEPSQSRMSQTGCCQWFLSCLQAKREDYGKMSLKRRCCVRALILPSSASSVSLSLAMKSKYKTKCVSLREWDFLPLNSG